MNCKLLHTLILVLLLVLIQACSLKSGTVEVKTLGSSTSNSNASNDGSTLSYVTITSHTITAPIETTTNSLTLAGTCITDATVVAHISTDETVQCANGQFSITLTASQDGYYMIQLHQEKGTETSGTKQVIWTYDTTGPIVQTFSDGSSATTTSSPTYSFTATDSLTAISSQEIAITTAQTTDSQTSWTTLAANATSGTVAGTYSTNTIYYTHLRLKDRLNNLTTVSGDGWASHDPVVITPVTDLVKKTNSNSITITGTCWSGTTIQLTGDATLSQACIASSFSFTFNKSIDGVYTYSFVQSGYGSTSTEVDVQWIRDTVSPTMTTTMNDGIAATSTTSPIYSFAAADSGAGIDSVEVAVGKTAGASDVVTWANIGTNTTGTVTGTFNQNQAYYTSVRVTDHSGNVTTQSGDGWIRLSAITLTAPSPTTLINNAASMVVSGSCYQGAIVFVDEQGTANDATVSCVSNAFTATINNSTDGVYQYQVSQSAFGSNSSAENIQWTRDATGPTFSGTLNDGSLLGINDDPTFSFTAATDAMGSIDHYSVAIGSTAGANNVMNWTSIGTNTSGTLAGTYTYDTFYYTSIRAYDNVGNYTQINGDGWKVAFSGVSTTALPTTVPEAYPYAGSVSLSFPEGGETFALDSSTCDGLSIIASTGFLSGVIGKMSGETCSFKIKVNYSGGYYLSDVVTLTFTDSLTMYFEQTQFDIEKGSAAQTATLRLSSAAPFATSIQYTLHSPQYEFSLMNLLSHPGLLTIAQGQEHIPISLEFLSSHSFAQDDYQILQIENGAKNNLPSLNLSLQQSTNSTLFTNVELGSTHSCGISNKKLYCWGENGSYQLGTGSSADQFAPKRIDSSSDYATISAGDSHSCGITTSGVLKCWGNNNYGKLGDGTGVTRTSPVVIESGTSYASVSAGSNHTCGITTLGVLKCWGNNSYGQLGDGTTTNSSIPVDIDSGTSYASISAASYHTCGITTSGVLKCWGYNFYGRLGDGTTTNSSIPVVIDSGTSYASISAGGSHTCGITTSGVLKCWGYNSSGQLGDGTTTQRTSPVVIESGTSYASISAGNHVNYGHTCGITTSGVLKCWGYNYYGQLGDGTTGNRSAPVIIQNGIQFQNVSAGNSNTCAIMTNGILKCWGITNYTGLSSLKNYLPDTAKRMLVNQNITHVDSGYQHTCLVLSTGDLKCWGNNQNGRLGDGTQTSRSRPTMVRTGVNFSKITAASNHSCGITTLGVLKCWGYNASGQLGNNSTLNSYFPIVIDNGTSYANVSAGSSHTCGITTSGVLKCWGSNLQGQLGDGTTTSSSIPVVIDSGTSYASISTGAAHTCGITTSGVLKCWGYNLQGQLGDGTTTNSSIPVVIDSGTSYASISTGAAHTCGITISGVLKCWGDNSSGRLGDGTTTDRKTPVLIDSGVSYASISAGGSHTCGITTSGVLKCWGDNTYAKLGNGNTSYVTMPISIDGGVTYTAISSGDYHTCGVVSGGTLKCWGQNDDDQSLNIDVTIKKPVPITELVP